MADAPTNIRAILASYSNADAISDSLIHARVGLSGISAGVLPVGVALACLAAQIGFDRMG